MIYDRLELLRSRKRIGSNLRQLRNDTFGTLHLSSGSTVCVHHKGESFVTFNGIFMGLGYDLGGDIWRTKYLHDDDFLN